MSGRGSTPSQQQRALRVGVIGCGFVATRHHLLALDAVAHITVVALADRDHDALERAAAGRAVARYADPLELIADPAVDAVAVCTPPASHPELVIAALGAGRHVLVEKPPALTLGECDDMIAAERESTGKVMVGLVYRRHRLLTAARQAVRRGRLGPLVALQSAFTSDSRLDPSRTGWLHGGPGGELLMEAAIHHADLWRWIAGAEVEQVSATAAPGDRALSLQARLDTGAVASALFSQQAAVNHQLVAYGRDATLTARLDRYDGLEVLTGRELPGDPAVRARRGLRAMRALPAMARSFRAGGDLVAAFRAQWRDFAGTVTGAGAPTPGLAEARRALEVVLAARSSLDTGVPVSPAKPGAKPEASRR